MQDNDTDMSDWTLQQKAQYVLQKMSEGDLRAEWFFDKLCERLGMDRNHAIHETVMCATGFRN